MQPNMLVQANFIPNPFIMASGKYTLLAPRGTNATANPAGDGFGSATVDAGGNAKLVGVLGDGSKVTQQVPISGNGHWPLYLPLYEERVHSLVG